MMTVFLLLGEHILSISNESSNSTDFLIKCTVHDSGEHVHVFNNFTNDILPLL